MRYEKSYLFYRYLCILHIKEYRSLYLNVKLNFFFRNFVFVDILTRRYFVLVDISTIVILTCRNFVLVVIMTRRHFVLVDVSTVDVLTCRYFGCQRFVPDPISIGEHWGLNPSQNVGNQATPHG